MSLGRRETPDKKALKEQDKIAKNTERANEHLKNIAAAAKHNPGMTFL